LVKNYVLDTNVLIHDPDSLFAFEDNNVFLPLPVLEEIDKLKSKPGEIGFNVRQVNRVLDQLRSQGSLRRGVKLPGGGILRVAVIENEEVHLPKFVSDRYADNWILAYTKWVADHSDLPTYLVTKDINMRVKADSLGIPAQDYLSDKLDIEEILSGVAEVELNESTKKRLVEEGRVRLDETMNSNLLPNTYVDFGDGMARVDSVQQSLELVKTNYNTSCWGIKPRNREQIVAVDLLLNDDIKLVTMIGTAGTGKTLLAIATGLRKVVDEGVYRRLTVTRPVVPMGKDIGYLPGKEEEKMKPWLRPVFDNLELIFSSRGKSLQEYLKRRDILEIEALSYIRGRSLPDQYVIIDEAQNLTPHEVKTIITRAGENTKIVLTGDPWQIDSPYLDQSSNGLVYVASRFINEAIAGHVVLLKGERSELAARAVELL